MFFRRGSLSYWNEREEPPFHLRFIAGNGTGAAWKSAKVTLYQDGSSVQSAELGPVADGERKTAAIIWYAPFTRKNAVPEEEGSPHELREHLNNDALVRADITKEETVQLSAMLEALTEDGTTVRREITFKAGYVPV
jgi:hypothetical protein